MAPYLFPYPIPGPVTFSTLLLDRSGAYTSQLAEATVARTRVQAALKAAAEEQPGSSALAVLEVRSSWAMIPGLISGCTCLPPVRACHHGVH